MLPHVHVSIASIGMTDTVLLVSFGIAAALLVLLLAVAFAYREGKRIGSLTRSDRFDRLPTSLRLGNTEWDICYTEFGEGGSREPPARMSCRQYDARVIGEGEDASGRRWSAEGVAVDDKLCYVYLDHGRSGSMVGAVMVDRRDSEEVLEGLRCVWSEARGVVAVQPIRLSIVPREAPPVSDSEEESMLPIGDAR